MPSASPLAQRSRGLSKKLRSLSPERLEEVTDFVDFLLQRQQDRQVTRDMLRLSQDALTRVWDNEEDAVYDQL